VMYFHVCLANKDLVMHFATGWHRIDWHRRMLKDSVQTNDQESWNVGGPFMDSLPDNNCAMILWSPYNYDIRVEKM